MSTIPPHWHRKRHTAFYGALVPPVGVEPTRPNGYLILSQARLPIPSRRPKKRERKQTRETTTRPQCAQPAGHTHTSRTIGQPNPRARTLSTGPPRPAQLTHQHREHPGANTQAPPAHTQRTLPCRHTPLRGSNRSRAVLLCCFRSPVGVAGLEPAASPSRRGRATKLRHTPKTGKRTLKHPLFSSVFLLLILTVARSRATVKT